MSHPLPQSGLTGLAGKAEVENTQVNEINIAAVIRILFDKNADENLAKELDLNDMKHYNTTRNLLHKIVMRMGVVGNADDKTHLISYFKNLADTFPWALNFR